MRGLVLQNARYRIVLWKRCVDGLDSKRKRLVKGSGAKVWEQEVGRGPRGDIGRAAGRDRG